MEIEVIVRVDGREVERWERSLCGTAAEVEEAGHRLGQQVGRVVTEAGLNDLARQVQRPACCGRPMRSCDRRRCSVQGLDGVLTIRRTRYRCRECGHTIYAGDAEARVGRHRVTPALAKRACQLATVEHFTELPGLLFDQHGVRLGHHELLELVHDVGASANRQAQAQQQRWQGTSPRRWPTPEVRPRRLYVSCDGIMYCTNRSEPDPHHEGQSRLLWQEMKVGCVYWQDEQDRKTGRWHKQITWGREPPEQFGQKLFLLACRCGYRQADETIFVADGGEWCWTIYRTYFSGSAGVLDWYHASEHVWTAARQVHPDPDQASRWAGQACERLAHGGEALVQWLETQRKPLRGRRRRAVDDLLGYLRPRQCLTDYARYRQRGWQIGSGMIESTAKQLVALRLKGPGMHWTEAGALAITALRAHSLNHTWHNFWNQLTLTI